MSIHQVGRSVGRRPGVFHKGQFTEFFVYQHSTPTEEAERKGAREGEPCWPLLASRPKIQKRQLFTFWPSLKKLYLHFVKSQSLIGYTSKCMCIFVICRDDTEVCSQYSRHYTLFKIGRQLLRSEWSFFVHDALMVIDQQPTGQSSWDKSPLPHQFFLLNGWQIEFSHQMKTVARTQEEVIEPLGFEPLCRFGVRSRPKYA